MTQLWNAVIHACPYIHLVIYIFQNNLSIFAELHFDDDDMRMSRFYANN